MKNRIPEFSEEPTGDDDAETAIPPFDPAAFADFKDPRLPALFRANASNMTGIGMAILKLTLQVIQAPRGEFQKAMAENWPQIEPELIRTEERAEKLIEAVRYMRRSLSKLQS